MLWRSYHRGVARGSEQSCATGHHLALCHAVGHHLLCRRPPPCVVPPLCKRKRRRREGEESLRDSGWRREGGSALLLCAPDTSTPHHRPAMDPRFPPPTCCSTRMGTSPSSTSISLDATFFDGLSLQPQGGGGGAGSGGIAGHKRSDSMDGLLSAHADGPQASKEVRKEDKE
jgi:hypothetical protein